MPASKFIDEAAKTILVVDDEEAILRTLESRLYFAGYNVLKAVNGRQALQIAKEKVPDLIILDIMMPGMDGFKVSVELKKDNATKDIPVFFLSALQNKDDEEKQLKGRGPGPNMILAKPFDGRELLRRIQELLT